MSILIRRFTCIDPGAWPERCGRRRVLVEHPDRAVLDAAAVVLHDAGYDVATCSGAENGTRCPLVELGRCRLADEADVVVTATSVGDAGALFEIYAQRATDLVVVDVSEPETAAVEARAPDAILLRPPLTPGSLRDAVREATREARP